MHLSNSGCFFLGGAAAVAASMATNAIRSQDDTTCARWFVPIGKFKATDIICQLGVNSQ